MQAKLTQFSEEYPNRQETNSVKFQRKNSSTVPSFSAGIVVIVVSVMAKPKSSQNCFQFRVMNLIAPVPVFIRVLVLASS